MLEDLTSRIRTRLRAMRQRRAERMRKRHRVLKPSDLDIYRHYAERREEHPNPLTRFGRKCFSQADEDGITVEIIRRMNLADGTFAELGVGNGLENNTLVLLALGWKGFWISGQDLAFETRDLPRLHFLKDWIYRENIFELWSSCLEKLKIDRVDVLSIDLDGNDYYVCEELLRNKVFPKLIIAEYNAKFIPPIRFVIKYDPDHRWRGDDYFGASLMSYNELLGRYGYKLICCNAATGANAFFVASEFADRFPEVPAEIGVIHATPFYQLPGAHGHRISVETIRNILE